jgi:hypothetical protein
MKNGKVAFIWSRKSGSAITFPPDFYQDTRYFLHQRGSDTGGYLASKNADRGIEKEKALG